VSIPSDVLGRAVQGCWLVLVVIALLYVVIGVGFHLLWKAAVEECRQMRVARGEFVEPEVFGGVLGLVFTVTNWPIYAWANWYHTGTIFATPCARAR